MCSPMAAASASGASSGLFQERGLPMTIFGCSLALERNKPAAEAIKQAGYDVCCHGYRWEKHFEMAEDFERERIARAVASLQTTMGERPLGWYCRSGPSVNTRRLLVEEGGFLYDSDAYDDELPYWTNVDGQSHPGRPLQPVHQRFEIRPWHLRHWRRFLPVLPGRVRLPVCRGPHSSENALHRPAHAADRPSRPSSRAATAAWITSAGSTASGSPAVSTSPGIGPPISRPRLRAEHHADTQPHASGRSRANRRQALPTAEHPGREAGGVRQHHPVPRRLRRHPPAPRRRSDQRADQPDLRRLAARVSLFRRRAGGPAAAVVGFFRIRRLGRMLADGHFTRVCTTCKPRPAPPAIFIYFQ